MSQVIIGMDPHKRSATIEVMAADEAVAGGGRYGTDAAGYAAMLAAVRRWPDRIWAIEGCRGVGRYLASRLVAAGERVVDVPPKLSARTRVFTAGQGRKTDATDTHAVALAATRMKGLHPVTGDAQLEVLRVLADRRRALGEDHTRMICQLHQLLADLIPGGAKKSLSAAQARALLARIRPRDAAGQARRRVAAELVTDLERIYQRKKAADKELAAALRPQGRRRENPDGSHARSNAACPTWCSGTHKGHRCQEGVRTWPGDYARRRAGLTVLLDPSSQLPGSSRRAARGQLERPQPRSGEDERA